MKVRDLARETVWVAPTGGAVHVAPDCPSLAGSDPIRKSASVLHQDDPVCSRCGGRLAGWP